LIENCHVDINETSDIGFTALHVACTRDLFGFSVFLIEQGAHVNALDAAEKTPLDVCTSQALRHLISQEGGRSAEVMIDNEEKSSILTNTQSPEQVSDKIGHLQEKSGSVSLMSDTEEKSDIMTNTQSPEQTSNKMDHLQEKSDSMSLNDILKMSENSSPDSPTRKKGEYSRRDSSVKEKIRELNLKKGIVISPSSQSGSNRRISIDGRIEKAISLRSLEGKETDTPPNSPGREWVQDLGASQDEISVCSMSVNEDQSSFSQGKNDLFDKSLDSLLTCNENNGVIEEDRENTKDHLNVSKIDQNVKGDKTDSISEKLSDRIVKILLSDDLPDATSSTPMTEELVESNLIKKIMMRMIKNDEDNKEDNADINATSSTPTTEDLAGINIAASQFVSPIKENDEDKDEDDDEDNEKDYDEDIDKDHNDEDKDEDEDNDKDYDEDNEKDYHDEDKDEDNDEENEEDFNEGNDADEIFIKIFNSHNHLNHSYNNFDPGSLKAVDEREVDLEAKLMELEKSTQEAVATAISLENEAKLHKQEIQALVEEVMKEKRKTAILEVELSREKDSYANKTTDHESRIFELEKKLEIEGSVAEERLRNIERNIERNMESKVSLSPLNDFGGLIMAATPNTSRLRSRSEDSLAVLSENIEMISYGGEMSDDIRQRIVQVHVPSYITYHTSYIIYHKSYLIYHSK
jgi:hypothetical protein